jgi:hypothetical protein
LIKCGEMDSSVNLLIKMNNQYGELFIIIYKLSKAKIKINKNSEEFVIKVGVKQGGILSPYLFNFFMNDLLMENDSQGFGAKIGKLNISLISYCDDLIILSPCVNRVNKILHFCSEYATKWKLAFNTSK